MIRAIRRTPKASSALLAAAVLLAPTLRPGFAQAPFLPAATAAASSSPARFKTLTVRDNPSQLPGVTIEVAFAHLSFERPLYVTHSRDGSDRLFVLEQDGVVHLFDNDPDVEHTTVALDLRDKVYRGNNEEGLLGMALHPRFAQNRYVYVHYSADRPRRGVIARFTMDERHEHILPETEQVILEQPQPFGNHKGGMIEFGPDGYLYIGFGDGGSGGDPLHNGQNLGTWLGKILRIDVGDTAAQAGSRGPATPYAVPADNPFVGTRGARPEILAYGMRNPWRFSFDRATGALWVGDVGQDHWEEVDIIVPGGNYGWSRREGAHDYHGGEGEGPFVEPVLEYTRLLARSVTGGYVYRGAKVVPLRGAYVHGDYETGYVWAAWWNGEQITREQLIGRLPHVSSFGEDRDGELLMTAFDGKIHRFANPSRR